MRVLHLIDGEHPAREGRDPGLSLAACRAAVERGRGEHEVVLIGGTGLAGRAVVAGLGDCPRLSAPLGQAVYATRALRRLIVDRAPDVLQAWSQTALVAARRAAPEVPRACAIVDGAMPLRAARHAVRASVVGVCSRAAQEELGGATHLLPAPALASGVADRGEARSALGLTESDVAVALLGADPQASAMRFVFLLGLLADAGAPTVGLVSPGAAQADRAQRFWGATKSDVRLLLVEGAALPAADLAVWEGGGAGPSHALPDRPAAATLPLIRAMALGVPVVASRGAAAEVQATGDAALGLGVNATLPELARVALPLAADGGHRAQTRVAVRAHAEQHHSDDRFVDGLSRLWADARRG